MSTSGRMFAIGCRRWRLLRLLLLGISIELTGRESMTPVILKYRDRFRKFPQLDMNFGELVIDNFAGGGGASTGIESALGRPVDIAINGKVNTSQGDKPWKNISRLNRH